MGSRPGVEPPRRPLEPPGSQCRIRRAQRGDTADPLPQTSSPEQGRDAGHQDRWQPVRTLPPSPETATSTPPLLSLSPDCLWPGMKPGGGGPTAGPESEPADRPLVLPRPWACPADVRLCGHLRKQKSQRRRFFVLRADPPRLECYESEKLFRAGRAPPKLSVSLAGACTISKRVDARQRHLIVLYTRDRSLGVAAACEAEQQAWYSALLEARAAAGEARAWGGRSRGRGAGAWVIASLSGVVPPCKSPKSSSNMKRLHVFSSRGSDSNRPRPRAPVTGPLSLQVPASTRTPAPGFSLRFRTSGP